MKARLSFLAAFLMLLPALAAAADWGSGRLDQYPDFPSKHVDARNITVWLPPDYDPNGAPYAVLYMHDGQNLFDPATGYGHKEWGIDEAATKLMREGKMRPTIIVGIWNTPKRLAEYVPAKAFDELADRYMPRVKALYGTPLSDEYLKFVVEEVKPFIDRTYNVDGGRESTFIMGSSMGALISIYAMNEYPDVFAGAGAVSTHWPVMADENGKFEDISDADMDAAARSFEAYLGKSLPKAGTHKLYLDAGKETEDRQYAAYEARIAKLIEAHGWVRGRDWMLRNFPGKPHNEDSWRERVHIPLMFLLGNKTSVGAE
jgi:enterochelin esterase-like enzyme